MIELQMVLVQIKLLSAEDGGRPTSVASGYRPQIRIGDEQVSGAIGFVGRETVKPGETCDARMRFISHDLVRDALRLGQRYDLFEGARKIGQMTVLDIPE